MSRKQNETAYLFMVSYIANTPLNEICVLDEDSPEAMAAAYRKSKKKETFGFDVHGNDEEFDAEEMTPSETEQARIKADKSIEKDVGLRHTEEVLWQNMLRIHSKNLARPHTNPDDIINYNSLGAILFFRMPYVLESMAQLLALLNAAPEELGLNSIVYHISCAVALLHFSRGVVFKTGKYTTQKTMNVQETYQESLLSGVFYTALNEAQQDHFINHVPPVTPASPPHWNHLVSSFYLRKVSL